MPTTPTPPSVSFAASVVKELGRRFHFRADKPKEKIQAQVHAGLYAEGFRDGQQSIAQMF